VKNFGGTGEYDEKLETNQSSSSEGIYTNDSNEREVGLYVLKVIPKVITLSQANQIIQGDDNQPTPHVLIKGEIVERVSKIQLGPNLRHEERRQYEDLLCKYIHLLFAFNYKDLREITMEQHKIELIPNAKPVRTKQGGGIQGTL